MGRQPEMDADVMAMCISMPIICVISVCIVGALKYFSGNAQFSVATDSVSTLDPKAGLNFNLTIAVASRSHAAEACINPGVFVEVFNRGIRVAASQALTERTCTRPQNMAEVPVVATAIALPVGQGQDSLAEEMRDGAAVFDFVLHVPAGSYGGDSSIYAWAVDCKGSRVGGAAVLCDSPSQSIL